MSDVYLMLTIVTLFVVVGAFLPFVENEFLGYSTTTDTSGITNTIGNNINADNSTNYSGLNIASKGVNIIASIFTMFFWSFNMPTWLNTIFLIPRIMLGFLFVRWLRGS